MKFYYNEKQGTFLRITEAYVPQLKTQGTILRNVETDKMICITNTLLHEKFQEMEPQDYKKVKK